MDSKRERKGSQRLGFGIAAVLVTVGMASNLKYTVLFDSDGNVYRVALVDCFGKHVEYFGQPHEKKVDAVKCANMLNRTFSVVSL